MNKILVIEDDAVIRANILDLLEAEGFEGIGAENGEVGLRLALQQQPDLVICDVGMPGIDGYEVFEVLSTQPTTAAIPFVFLSARAEREDIRRGMALGADDYLTKPFTRTDLLDAIVVRLKRRRSEGNPGQAQGERRSSQSDRPPAPPEQQRIVVVDPHMVEVLAQVDKFARSPMAVLVLGETGVGKEVIAEEVHERSGRKGRFVPVNCAALTETLLESELFGHEKGAFTGAVRAQEGLFEAAEGGTLFLDEIGELPLSTQVKLLRVLEDKKVMRVGGRTTRAVDVRFVSATHRDIEHDVERGVFRQDLYFRLSGITVNVPPLRDRARDIPPLVDRFVAASCRSVHRSPAPRVSPEALAILLRYAWPGNIRELRNVVERAVLLCEGDQLLPTHLPQKLSSLPPLASQGVDPRSRLLHEMEQVERQRVIDALAQCGGNQTQAAEVLGISRRTLVTRLGLLDLPRPRKGPRTQPQ
jgi:DNA-binding NtrC family response regulator